MKVTSILIFLAVLCSITGLEGFTVKKCSDKFGENPENQAYSKDFCRSTEYDSDKKCCFLKYKNERGTFYNCLELSMSEFARIKNTIKYYETQNGINIKSLECDSSSYLYGSLLFILIFLL